MKYIMATKKMIKTTVKDNGFEGISSTNHMKDCSCGFDIAQPKGFDIAQLTLF